MKDAENAPEAESGQASTDGNVETSQPVPIKILMLRVQETWTIGKVSVDNRKDSKQVTLQKLFRMCHVI